tara:strand:- start:63 stop:1337 length:1275 start_codon:yes stop_codon:yes gene_type:complete
MKKWSSFQDQQLLTENFRSWRNEKYEEFDSPDKEFHDEDEAAQHDVMRDEEERYGLPFTNRDIRLLLLRYVDKLVELESNGDYDTMAAVSDRVINYIDNLILKVADGTAAYPAYSNKVDKKLSMFYYQTPDIGEEFKRNLLSSIAYWRGLAPNAWDNMRKFLTAATGIDPKYESDARGVIQDASGYELLRASRRFGYSPVKDTGHIEMIQQRMNDSKTSVAKLRSRLETEEMGTEYSNEKLLDILEDAKDAWYRALNELPRYNPDPTEAYGTPSPGIKDEQEAAIEEHLAELESLIVSNDFMKAHRAVNSTIRALLPIWKSVATGGEHGRMQPNDQNLRTQVAGGAELLRFKEALLNFKEVLKDHKYTAPQGVKLLIRNIRKAAEGFQTMFESKKRNTSKITRKQLKQVIRETIALVRVNKNKK